MIDGPHSTHAYGTIFFIHNTNNILRSVFYDDISTIHYPDLYKHILDIYPPELQLNKSNHSRTERPLVDMNIKEIDNKIQITDKRDESGFPISNFPWLRDDAPRLPLT